MSKLSYQFALKDSGGKRRAFDELVVAVVIEEDKRDREDEGVGSFICD